MKYSKICLIFSLIVGLSLPVFAQGGEAEFQNPFLTPEFLKNHATLEQFNVAFGLPKSAPREATEQLILSLIHESIELKNGKVAVDLKKGITATRDTLYKRAAYGFLSAAVLEGIQKAKNITTDDAKKVYKKEYDKQIKPFVYDGFDIIFRGIKYMNDDTKEQTLKAYIQNDFGPYIIKKKIVWLTQLAMRRALERNEYGRLIAGAYDIACSVPLLGAEFEEWPRVALEYVYDKSINAGKNVGNYVADKIVTKVYVPFFQHLFIQPMEQMGHMLHKGLHQKIEDLKAA